MFENHGGLPHVQFILALSHACKITEVQYSLIEFYRIRRWQFADVLPSNGLHNLYLVDCRGTRSESSIERIAVVYSCMCKSTCSSKCTIRSVFPAYCQAWYKHSTLLKVSIRFYCVSKIFHRKLIPRFPQRIDKIAPW